MNNGHKSIFESKQLDLKRRSQVEGGGRLWGRQDGKLGPWKGEKGGKLPPAANFLKEGLSKYYLRLNKMSGTPGLTKI